MGVGEEVSCRRAARSNVNHGTGLTLDGSLRVEVTGSEESRGVSMKGVWICQVAS